MSQSTVTAILVVGIAAVVVYLGVRAFLRWRASRKRMVSLVWLLGAPRTVSEAYVRRIAVEALGATFDEHNPEATQFVITAPTPPVEGVPEGAARCFILQLPQGTFLVNNMAFPYMDSPESFAQDIADKRLREAIAGHRAWLSVDVLGEVRDEEKQAAYRAIGKLVAQMAGDDCLALYCPELQRCNEFDKTLLETLRSETPLALFEYPTFAPIVNVDGDDPRMAAAVAEAQRRWPEFVAQFRAKRGDGPPFLAKAEFRDGDTAEFMWVAVTGIDVDRIHGTLENSPHDLTNVREGQEVSVPLAALNDWMYIQGEEPVGGFTLKAIAEIHEGRK